MFCSLADSNVVRNASSPSGFTLIELLVVVAIIAILAAIAIPQFAAYRARGFDARSVADLHNAASSEEAYFLENSHYTDCIGTPACAATLPAFTSSFGVDLSMFQVVVGVDEHFTGRAFHPNGQRSSLATAWMWNSSNGGLQ